MGDEAFKTLYTSYKDSLYSKSATCNVDILDLSDNNLTLNSAVFISNLILIWNVKKLIVSHSEMSGLNKSIIYELSKQDPAKMTRTFNTCMKKQSASVFESIIFYNEDQDKSFLERSMNI